MDRSDNYNRHLGEKDDDFFFGWYTVLEKRSCVSIRILFFFLENVQNIYVLFIGPNKDMILRSVA